MTGNIINDANALKGRLSQEKFLGEEIYLFADKYSGNRSLVYEALLLTLDINSTGGVTQVYRNYGVELIDKILKDYAEGRGEKAVAEIRQKEKKALQRYEDEYGKRQTMVEMTEVFKRFYSSNFTLENINLSLNLGEITGIIGPNANGKSTLLKVIVGDLKKDSGKLDYPEFNIGEKFPGWPAVKRKIAYIPQELIPWKGSLKEVLLYEASRHGLRGEDCELQVDFIIHRLDLTEYVHLRWNQLSGGYKLRFELAKALVWRPSFLILDEPLANLDVAAQLTILNDLRNLAHSFKNPICVIITSQHIHEIEFIADKLLVLETGKINYFGKPLEYNQDATMLIAELSSKSPLSKIRQVLHQTDISLEDRGFCYLVKAPVKYTLSGILEQILDGDIEVDYFRDITHSVKQIFYENN